MENLKKEIMEDINKLITSNWFKIISSIIEKFLIIALWWNIKFLGHKIKWRLKDWKNILMFYILKNYSIKIKVII